MSALSQRLLAWFDAHQRCLPWRGRRDPYAIWVSEIMLQQTRVEAVLPHYRRWMKQFPSVLALARARPSEALKAWEGLGYYSRARNLHAAARDIVRARDGKFPRTSAEWETLRGVGRYTAGAIASIALGERAAAVDGNARRVLTRVFAIRDSNERELWRLAERLLPQRRVGDFNQALMELGATVCVPRAPRCALCPLEKLCAARRRGWQARLPLRRRDKLQPLRRLALFAARNGRVLLARRGRSGRLAGFWELPGLEVSPGSVAKQQGESLKRSLREQYGLRIARLRWLQRIKYRISRFAVTLDVFRAETRAEKLRNCRWVVRANLRRLPMPAADRRVLATALRRQNATFSFRKATRV